MPIDAYLEARHREPRIRDTIRLHHHRALIQASGVLVGPDGLIDAGLIPERETQVVDSLYQYYTAAGTQMLQSATQDPLLQALAGLGVFGLDYPELQTMVQRHGADLIRENEFINGMRRYGRNTERALAGATAAHITDADIDPILDHTHTRNIVDRTLVDRVGAATILNVWDEYHGDVPRTLINHYLLPQYRI